MSTLTRGSTTKTRGYELLRQGTIAEERGDGAKAVEYYERGLDTLLGVLKGMPEGPEKETLRNTISQFLSRAESIKGKQESRRVPLSIRQTIEHEVLDTKPGVRLADVVGLEGVKQALYEAIVLPSINPGLFTGLRAPPRGILLFGPPGNGKTMIAKAIATECKATFFSISSASLTSKFVGESEKLVRGLFAVARERQPAIIFIDEIDSILSTRQSDDNEASRRLKTEFLVAFDGIGTHTQDKLLVIAATNLPQQLDEAVLRRFAKRIYVPLPTPEVRQSILTSLLREHRSNLSRNELASIVNQTAGFSASDLSQLCNEAAMGPIRGMKQEQVAKLRPDQVPPISFRHFQTALNAAAATVSTSSVNRYEAWNDEYGTKLAPTSSPIECCMQ